MVEEYFLQWLKSIFYNGSKVLFIMVEKTIKATASQGLFY